MASHVPARDVVLHLVWWRCRLPCGVSRAQARRPPPLPCCYHFCQLSQCLLTQPDSSTAQTSQLPRQTVYSPKSGNQALHMVRARFMVSQLINSILSHVLLGYSVFARVPALSILLSTKARASPVLPRLPTLAMSPHSRRLQHHADESASSTDSVLAKKW